MWCSTTTEATSARRCAPAAPAIRGFTFHFTPTSASWYNVVEGFFSTLTRRLQRGTFTGVTDLQATIKRYIAEHNRSARPLVRTKPAAAIFNALNRAPEPSV